MGRMQTPLGILAYSKVFVEMINGQIGFEPRIFNV